MWSGKSTRSKQLLIRDGFATLRVRHPGSGAAAMDGQRDRAAGQVPAPRRMAAAQREQMILDAAIEFFAEHGFDAQIRSLAERIGVSQGLIFRYFATKEELVERVFQRTFLARWDPGWELLLGDRSVPLRERLRRFLKSYLGVVDDRRWIRISMHSSLAGHDLTHRYVQVFVTGLLRTIASEVRAHRGEPATGDITAAELERVWHLHSTIVYFLVRKHIHGTPVPLDTDLVVSVAVDTFIDGIDPRPGGGSVS